MTAQEKGPIVDRTFGIEFLDPGVYAMESSGTQLWATLLDHQGDKR